jgi:glycosyltransferase involved in cell wall biosynthesis
LVGSSGKLAELPKVLVVIPTYGQIDTAFAESLRYALVGNGQFFRAESLWLTGYITDEARNQGVINAQKSGFDYVFFADSDMVFPAGALGKLLKHYQEIEDELPPVVGGLYNTRSDYRINAYDWVEEKGSFISKNFELNTGIHKVDCVATGCQLIDLELFNILPWPWFEYKYEMLNGEKRRWSEDMVFGERCMKAKVQHYVDTDVVCDHIIEMRVRQIQTNEMALVKMSGDKF